MHALSPCSGLVQSFFNFHLKSTGHAVLGSDNLLDKQGLVDSFTDVYHCFHLGHVESKIIVAGLDFKGILS